MKHKNAFIFSMGDLKKFHQAKRGRLVEMHGADRVRRAEELAKVTSASVDEWLQYSPEYFDFCYERAGFQRFSFSSELKQAKHDANYWAGLAILLFLGWLLDRVFNF